MQHFIVVGGAYGAFVVSVTLKHIFAKAANYMGEIVVNLNGPTEEQTHAYHLYKSIARNLPQITANTPKPDGVCEAAYRITIMPEWAQSSDVADAAASLLSITKKNVDHTHSEKLSLPRKEWTHFVNNIPDPYLRKTMKKERQRARSRVHATIHRIKQKQLIESQKQQIRALTSTKPRLWIKTDNNSPAIYLEK